MGANRKNVSGQVFGRLTALQDVGATKCRHRIWQCVCECGNFVEIPINQLTSGKTKSCGCLQKETTSKLFTKHGFRCDEKSTKIPRIYRTWLHMKERCYNPKSKGFQYYGGKNIIVCDEWKNDFLSFYKWAMKNGYNDKLSIDRIDFNGNYEPNNCRWATSAEQARNTSRNRYYQISGEKVCLKDISEKFGISKSSILWRTEHQGKRIEEVLNL